MFRLSFVFDFFGNIYISWVSLQSICIVAFFTTSLSWSCSVCPLKANIVEIFKGLFQAVLSEDIVEKWLKLKKRNLFRWFERVQICLHSFCPSKSKNCFYTLLFWYPYWYPLYFSELFLCSSFPPHTVPIFHLATEKHNNKPLTFTIMYWRNSLKVIQE